MFNTHYLIKVPKEEAPDPAWHTILGRARPTSTWRPCGPGKTPLGDEVLPVGCHTETIVWTVFGHRLQRLCRGFAFHTPIPSLTYSRESPSIESSLTFKGHISQSCGADIQSVHSFLTGTRRLILSVAAWGIHPSSYIGIDASIASPAFNLG